MVQKTFLSRGRFNEASPWLYWRITLVVSWLEAVAPWGILLLRGWLKYGVMRKSPNLYQVRVVELLNQYHLGKGNEVQTYFWRKKYFCQWSSIQKKIYQIRSYVLSSILILFFSTQAYLEFFLFPIDHLGFYPSRRKKSSLPGIPPRMTFGGVGVPSWGQRSESSLSYEDDLGIWFKYIPFLNMFKLLKFQVL